MKSSFKLSQRRQSLLPSRRMQRLTPGTNRTTTTSGTRIAMQSTIVKVTAKHKHGSNRASLLDRTIVTLVDIKAGARYAVCMGTVRGHALNCNNMVPLPAQATHQLLGSLVRISPQLRTAQVTGSSTAEQPITLQAISTISHYTNRTTAVRRSP